MLRTLAVWMTSLFDHHVDNLLSLLISTTEDLQRPLHRLLFCLIMFPVRLTFAIIFLPVGLVGWILWILVSHNTKTCRLSYSTANESEPCSFQGNLAPNKVEFKITTINTCLHSDLLCRLNNLSRPSFRAKRIGEILSGMHRSPDNDSYSNEIAPDDGLTFSTIQKSLSFKRTMDLIEIPPDYYSNISQHSPGRLMSATVKTKSRDFDDIINHDILCQFPELDFLLVQEVFNLSAAKVLVKSLHKRFPYIIYDAREDGLKSNLWSLGSGLLIASRFPITRVNFDVFKHKDGYAKVSCLGLLQAKIDLGTNFDGKRLVGYLTNTHLQPYQGASPVHWAQLLQIRAACATMRTLTSTPRDLILFDIVGGDFNLDNMSPVDQMERTHPLFEEFVDVCREAPGWDKPWTVGSEMRHPPFHDRLVHTPEGLRHALMTPDLRTRYILDADVMEATADLPKQMPQVDKIGEVYVTDKCGKRRVDYILFNKDYPMVVSSYNAVTELAGLTDHLAFTMTFSPSLHTT